MQQRHVERERAALAGRAPQPDFPSQQSRQLTADGQPQPGTPEGAAGRGVGLLERLEDQLVLLGRNADPGIGDGKGEHLLRAPERGGAESVGAEFDLDRERDPPRRRELEGVGEQVLQHLLQSRCVGEDHSRDRRRDRDRELDPRRKGGPERALERLGYLADLHRADVHLQPSRLDLREVEDLVDEREQVLPAGVDGRRVLHFLRVERGARVLRQQAGQDEHAVQRRAQLVRHVGEKLRLVAGDERELARLVLQVAGALRQLCVGGFQLLEQVLGPRGGGDGVQHHADALCEPLQQHAMDGLESRQRAELDDAFHLALEEHRHDQQARERRVADARADAHVLARELVDRDEALLHRALPHQALARAEVLRGSRAGVPVGADPPHGPCAADEERRILRADLRRQLVEHDPAQLLQRSPPLQEPREPGKIGVQPVLFLVRLRALAQIDDHLVDAVGQVLPASCHPGHVRLSAQLSLRAYLARDADHFRREGAELIDHGVHGRLELADLASRGHGDLARQLSVCHRGGHQRDVPHLRGEVSRQRVHAFGEVLPGAGDAGNLRLPAQRSLGADLARDPGHLRREGAKLVDHLVDRLLQLEDLALRRDGDLAREIAAGNRGGDERDVAHLVGQVARQHVDVVGEVLPHPGHARDVGLRAQTPFGAHFLRHAGHLGSEGAQLVDHGVDGVLQRQHLSAYRDGDLLREVAVGHGGRDVGDVAHLVGEVSREDVHVVGEVLPHARDALHVGLTAQLAFRSHFTGHARYLGGERPELVDHLVDGLLELEDLALRGNGDLPGQVSSRDGGGHERDVADLGGEVRRQQVHRVDLLLPGSRCSEDPRLSTERSCGSHLTGDADDFAADGAEPGDQRVHAASHAEGLPAQRSAFRRLQRHGPPQLALLERPRDRLGLPGVPGELVEQVVQGAERLRILPRDQ